LKETSRRLYTYARQQKAGYSLSILFFLLASATEPVIPALLGTVLNEGFAKDTKFPLWAIPVTLVLVFAVRGVFTFLAQYMMTWANSKTVLLLRRDLVAALLRADAQLFHEVTPGLAVSKVINDPQSATTQIGGALTTLLRDGTHTIVMLGYLLYLNWQLTLLSLISVPLLAYVIRKAHHRVQVMGGLLYDSQLRLVSVVDDIARAWRVIRTFDAGSFELQRFGREADRHRRASIKSTTAGALMTPLSQTITSLGVAAILYLALVQARHDTTSVGDFVAFITALLLLVSRVRSLTDLSQSVISGLIQARGSFTLLDAPAEPDDGHVVLDVSAGDVELSGVQVQYPGSELSALKSLTLSVKPGQTIALVGASGAGKSTVVNLLLGFVVPAKGEARIDGHAISDVTKASLRRQFAVVSQDIVLFDASVADNVVYALERDDARVEQCLRAANLWEHVNTMPGGVEAQIGSNGSRLSGGQRQRLAIARALYKNAPIWIFDEATSSLDSESERAVQGALEQWHGEKSLILIAHRLSTVRNADVIYVMGDGGVIESGSHQGLMEAKGAYASMVNQQQAG
jgi:ATP-binding cassette, subfamily B, bacterial MsbA